MGLLEPADAQHPSMHSTQGTACKKGQDSFALSRAAHSAPAGLLSHVDLDASDIGAALLLTSAAQNRRRRLRVAKALLPVYKALRSRAGSSHAGSAADERSTGSGEERTSDQCGLCFQWTSSRLSPCHSSAKSSAKGADSRCGWLASLRRARHGR